MTKYIFEYLKFGMKNLNRT